MIAGQSFARDHPFDQPFRGDLAALIGADPFFLGQRYGFVRRRAVGPQTQRGDAAGINDALDAGANGLAHNDARAVHIGGINLAAVACPQPVIGGDVKHVTRTSDRATNRIRVTDIAFDKLQIEPIEMKAGTAAPHQRPQPESGADQCSRYGRADKSRGTRD